MSSGSSLENLNEFASYYANLFSHQDRNSNEKQMKIESDVKQMFQDSLETPVGNQFSVVDIKK